MCVVWFNLERGTYFISVQRMDLAQGPGAIPGTAHSGPFLQDPLLRTTHLSLIFFNTKQMPKH